MALVICAESTDVPNAQTVEEVCAANRLAKENLRVPSAMLSKMLEIRILMAEEPFASAKERLSSIEQSVFKVTETVNH